MNARRHILMVHTAADPRGYMPRLRKLGYRFSLIKKRPTAADRACFDDVIDMDFQADTAATIEAVRLLNAEHPIDGVMSYSESGVLSASLIAWSLGLPGNSPRAALHARNKYLMRKALRDAGLQTPPFFVVRDAASVRELVVDYGPMVLKPISGSSSYGVIRIVPEDSVETIDAHMGAIREYISTYREHNPQYPFEFWLPEAGCGIREADVMDPCVDFLLEGYIGGQQVSVDGIVSQGTVTCLGVIEIERIADQDFFLEYEEWMPTRLGSAREADIEAQVRRAVRALGLWQGSFHCELKVDGDSITVLEIAARRGADNISDFIHRLLGVDVYEEGVRLACGERRVFPELERRGAMKMRYFLPEVSGTVLAIGGEEEVRSNPHVSELVFECEPGDRVLTPPDGYEFLGYVSVVGKTLAEADEALETVYPQIRFTIAPEPRLSTPEREASTLDLR